MSEWCREGRLASGPDGQSPMPSQRQIGAAVCGRRRFGLRARPQLRLPSGGRLAACGRSLEIGQQRKPISGRAGVGCKLEIDIARLDGCYTQASAGFGKHVAVGDRQFATSLLDVVQTILASTNLAIQSFRQCRDDTIIKRLAWAARDEDDFATTLRVRAANILANVVDSTDVCFVLHQLRDRSIGIRGRANLLAVTLAMAGYAYQENAKAIKDTLTIVSQNLPKDAAELSDTQRLILNVTDRLANSENASTLLPPYLQKYCKSYSYDGPLPN